MKQNNMMLVDASALPEVFTRVLRVKNMLRTGEEHSAALACKAAGISRSAYYKYKDSVFEYNADFGRIITVHTVLFDRPGILSKFMSVLYESGANILTVNQNIPAGDFAMVSIAFRSDALNVGLSELNERLKSLDGVKSIESLCGE